jgi:chemotaxis protein MotD
MTSMSLPSQSPAQLAHGAASVLAGDRGAGNAPESGNSAAFDAALNAFNDSATQPQATKAPANGDAATSDSTPLSAQPIDENSAEPGSWRAVSARHNLGSGVLIALDKRLNPAGSAGQTRAAAKELKTAAGTEPDAAALSGAAWAALIGGANGATGATAPPSSSAPTLAGLASAATASSAPAPAPVEVKVVRSITYLGLDPTAPSIQSASSASAQPKAKNSPEFASVQAEPGDPTSSVLVHAQPDASATSSGGQQKPDAHGSSANGSAGGSSGAKESGAVQGSPASGIAQTDAGAIFANGQMLVPVDQLADIVATAAQDLGAQSSDATAAGAAANSAAAARTTPVKELDVQLNPASLGAVSIQMRLSNGNLSISIKADQTDTFQLIDNQRGAIADKLKSLNFSVDSLTVKASDATAGNGASVGSSNTGTSGYGEAQQGQSGQSADGSRDGRFSQGDSSQRQSPRQNPSFTGDTGSDGNFGHRVV